jgi:hypothetical protein
MRSQRLLRSFVVTLSKQQALLRSPKQRNHALMVSLGIEDEHQILRR